MLLQVEHLSRAGAFSDVGFSLRAGEILGITGLLGSGRSEIAEAVFGIHPADSGTITVAGERRTIRSIRDAVHAGIGYVPEDRLTQGLFLDVSIADNMVAASLDSYRTRGALLDRRRVRSSIADLFARLRIQAPHAGAVVRSLSGGNAQRVVLAKWLDRRPAILVLNGPDRRGGHRIQGGDHRDPARTGRGRHGDHRDLGRHPRARHQLPPDPHRARRQDRRRAGGRRDRREHHPAEDGRVSALARLRGPNNEGILVAVILVVVLAMSLASPAFFTANTFFALVRSSMVPLVLALGVLLVLVSGGIDVSFPAIAIFAAYATVTWVVDAGADPGPVVVVAVAMAVGALLGLANGVVIARFRLPTLIVTLGTQSVFRGVLIAYVGSAYISAAGLPSSISDLSGAHLFDVPGGGYLHFMVIPVALVTALVAFLLNRTVFGRSIFAIGGDTEAARRVGIRVVRTQVLLYVLVGALAAFGGVVFVILGRNANPQSLVGIELDIIAAVVLGGASIFGGRGSVLGTVLGVVLVQLINNNLVLLGVPSTWQRAAVGLLLLLGVSVQALTGARGRRRPAVGQAGQAGQKEVVAA